MTFENALTSVMNGLDNVTSLSNKYIMVFDASGAPVGKIKADSIHTDEYGYITVGTLE